MGKIKIIPTDMILEKKIFERKEKNLRSPHYILNLFNKLGDKKCALCNCQIPELIQGAHILPVAIIKKMNSLSLEKRLEYALDGDNGLWLCENHHKLFDQGMISFDDNGNILLKNNLDQRNKNFISEITKNNILPIEILTEKFLWYMKNRRNYI